MSNFHELNPEDSTPITPAFPRWDRSFVSGSGSALFRVRHAISNRNPQLLFSFVDFLEHAEGPPGHVHGGASAGLLDEIMGILVWHCGHPSLTRHLQLQFKRPIPLQESCIGVTRIQSVVDQRIEVESILHSLEGKPLVIGQGGFHRLSEDQLAKFNPANRYSSGKP